jgi:hypothetical protein
LNGPDIWTLEHRVLAASFEERRPSLEEGDLTDQGTIVVFPAPIDEL